MYLTAGSNLYFFFQAEDGIRDLTVTGVQTCALPIYEVSRKNRLISPTTVGIANVGNSTPRSQSNRSIALIRPIVPTWTMSSIGSLRSGERRVGEEGRSRWAPYHLKKKKKNKE